MNTVTSACDAIAKAMGVESKEYHECKVPLMKQIVQAEKKIAKERRDEEGRKLVRIPNKVSGCASFEVFLRKYIEEEMKTNRNNFDTQVYERIYMFQSTTLTNRCKFVLDKMFNSFLNIYKHIGDFRVYTSFSWVDNTFRVSLDNEQVVDTYFPINEKTTEEDRERIRRDIEELSKTRKEENKNYNVTRFIG